MGGPDAALAVHAEKSRRIFGSFAVLIRTLTREEIDLGATAKGFDRIDRVSRVDAVSPRLTRQ
jgi:hypothetical protein